MSCEAAETVGRLIKQLAGEGFVPDDEIFWEALFGGGEPLAVCAASIDLQVGAHCLELVSSSRHTQAFQHLLRRMSSSLERGADASTALSTANAIHIVRAVTKAVIEQLEPDAAEAFFAVAMAELDYSTQLLIQLVCSNITGATYIIVFEAVMCLTVMLSTELCRPVPEHARDPDPCCLIILKRKAMASAVTQSLLQLHVKTPPAPAALRQHLDQPTNLKPKEKGILRRMGSAASSVLNLPYRAASLVLSSNGKSSPLGDEALNLLLLLLYHGQAFNHPDNSFRGAITHLADGQGLHPKDIERQSTDANCSEAPPTIPFANLLRTLRQGLGSHASGLLLYTLLANSMSFTEYILVCSEPDAILLPLLEQLYQAHGTGPEESVPDSRACSRIYLLLASMLILCQDSAYVAELHRTQLSGGLAWFKERPSGPMSVGHLTMLILLRSAYISLSRGRTHDIYIATNALAVIANLAPLASDLSAHASQRLVSLYDLLHRRMVKLKSRVKELQGEDDAAELRITTDFLRTVLEVINLLLVNTLPRNPELAYTLLHRQELFAGLAGHSEFDLLAKNIFSVVDFFNEHVERARSEQEWEWSVDRVLAVIRDKLRTWHPDRLEHVSVLSFSYEELQSAADFFAPYVWQVVTMQRVWIAWSDSCIRIFRTKPRTNEISGSLPDLDLADITHSAADRHAVIAPPSM